MTANIPLSSKQIILVLLFTMAISVFLLLDTFRPSNILDSSETTTTTTVPCKFQSDQPAADVDQQEESDSVPRRCVFLDLGANRADTLKVFLKEPDAKFKYDFPVPFWATHETCEIYLFEANPLFTPALKNASVEYNAKGINVTVFPETAVAAVDGSITLHLDTTTVEHDFWGSSILDEDSNRPSVVISAIDISTWIMKNFKPRDYVLVKMDIEKAEYNVLPRMLEVEAWKVMDVLLIEFHDPPRLNNGIRDIAMAATVKLSEHVFIPHYDSPS
ncbi:hypothetical protein SmJEL517_g04251 [Synchytrium microbalum]|uniref:Methyltransferase FkbM domain-containing protein n=1 Tax=Synchytrium microbalum TaxID=1806994 RepID=A0A507C037_9FUNG|nr:uncharacterized protein SmJEL517_g04251 [Synchytrium microbalum]TPX32751.1 hypothetical protein SmJEL517_g04251 [Synchytrium microbalum]